MSRNDDEIYHIPPFAAARVPLTDAMVARLVSVDCLRLDTEVERTDRVPVELSKSWNTTSLVAKMDSVPFSDCSSGSSAHVSRTRLNNTYIIFQGANYPPIVCATAPIAKKRRATARRVMLNRFWANMVY